MKAIDHDRGAMRRSALVAMGTAVAGLWTGRAMARGASAKASGEAKCGAADGFDGHQKLLAIEEIHTLRARRDYLLDKRDWQAYAALHAPDHVSVSVTAEPLVGGSALVGTVSRKLQDTTVIHHTHSPIIEFENPDLATGIWAMNFSTFWTRDGREHFSKVLGYYHERYARRDGKWLFIHRRVEVLHRETCCAELGGHPPD